MRVKKKEEIIGASSCASKFCGVAVGVVTATATAAASTKTQPQTAMSALALLAEQGIHADREGLHVMPAEMLSNATALQEASKEFLSKTKQFNDIVGDFIEVMEGKSKIIETEKLKAIGVGNRVDHEKEVRKRKQVCVRRHNSF